MQIPVIDNILCNRMYAKIANKVKLHISDDMMCAGFDAGGKDACQVSYIYFKYFSVIIRTYHDSDLDWKMAISLNAILKSCSSI